MGVKEFYKIMLLDIKYYILFNVLFFNFLYRSKERFCEILGWRVCGCRLGGNCFKDGVYRGVDLYLRR